MVTYFIQMGDSVKIGTTNNTHHRLMQLKVSFPHDLTLLGLSDLPEKEAQGIAATAAEIAAKYNVTARQSGFSFSNWTEQLIRQKLKKHGV